MVRPQASRDETRCDDQRSPLGERCWFQASKSCPSEFRETHCNLTFLTFRLPWQDELLTATRTSYRTTNCFGVSVLRASFDRKNKHIFSSVEKIRAPLMRSRSRVSLRPEDPPTLCAQQAARARARNRPVMSWCVCAKTARRDDETFSKNRCEIPLGR